MVPAHARSACEPHREWIEAQVCLGRNAMAIYQELVDQRGFRLVARLRADPHGFLDALKTPAILDEVQNVPEVYALVRAPIDRQPRRSGQ